MSKSELYNILAYLDLEQYEKVVAEIEKKDKEIERLNKVLEYLELHFSNREDYELSQIIRDTKQANIEWLDKAIGSDKE